MLGVGETLPDFKVVGVKPKFEHHEENGVSAFEDITKASFPGKWKVIFFYPKDFTFVCPTEIAEFARLGPQFEERDAVVLGGSTDNEHSKLGWRREHADLHKLPIWSFADNSGKFARALGILDEDAGVALETEAGAAGDIRRGQSLVVWAIREGRQAARAVDEFLMGSSELPR